VTRPEVAPAAFLVFLDSHVWVAECYTLDSVAILDVHHRLLFTVARLTFADPARLVQRHLHLGNIRHTSGPTPEHNSCNLQLSKSACLHSPTFVLGQGKASMRKHEPLTCGLSARRMMPF
jgi:hypothetical protein